MVFVSFFFYFFALNCKWSSWFYVICRNSLRYVNYNILLSRIWSCFLFSLYCVVNFSFDIFIPFSFLLLKFLFCCAMGMSACPTQHNVVKIFYNICVRLRHPYGCWSSLCDHNEKACKNMLGSFFVVIYIWMHAPAWGNNVSWNFTFLKRVSCAYLYRKKKWFNPNFQWTMISFLKLSHFKNRYPNRYVVQRKKLTHHRKSEYLNIFIFYHLKLWRLSSLYTDITDNVLPKHL